MKRDAELYLATVEVSKVRGEWVDPTRSRVILKRVCEEWYRAQVQIKPTTRSGYRFTLDKHVLPQWGTTRLVDVTHGDVQTWVGDLSKSLGPSMVRQIHLVQSGSMNFAIRDGRMVKIPCIDVQLPRLVKKQRGYLSHPQVKLMASECGSCGDVVLFMAYAGLRWGKMAALTAQHVDFERHRVKIVQAISDPRGKIV